MKTVSMSGSLRGNVGKKDAKAVRKEGMVPCVLYGGKEQTHFSVTERSFQHVVFTPEICFINLNIDGKEHQAILQDIQYHPVTDKILHADMLELVPGKQIIMGVPIKLTGVSPGVLKGGKLIQKMRKIKVKALPEHMPDSITISIEKLEINDSVKTVDLQRENLTLLDPINAVVVGVRVTRIVEEPKTDAELAKEAAAATEEAATKEAATKEGAAKETKPAK
jgi:large subunit ribosomal protein L25